MSKDTRTLDWLVQQLEHEKTTFDDDDYPLSTHQKGRLDSFYQLLDEDEISLSSGSAQRRLSRVRVRHTLLDVLSTPSLGSEVLLLLMLATTITELAKVTQRGLFQGLGRWWSRVAHPQGLKSASASVIVRIQAFRPVQDHLAHKSQNEGTLQYAQTENPLTSGTSFLIVHHFGYKANVVS
jgi:hypothetical protein